MEKKDVIADLCERLHVLRLRYQVVFHIATPANPPYIPMAESLGRGLLDGDRDAMVHVRTLIDPTEMERPAFWGTPLGRLLFASGGYGSSTCTQATAAAVLDCSRQWVSAMVREEKLTRAMGGAVYVGELKRILQDRVDRLVK